MEGNSAVTDENLVLRTVFRIGPIGSQRVNADFILSEAAEDFCFCAIRTEFEDEVHAAASSVDADSLGKVFF